MNKYILTFLIFSSTLHADDRISVEQPSKEKQLVKDLTESLSRHTNNLDLDNYMSCFTSEYSKKNGKNIALKFLVSNSLILTVDNFYIINSTDKKVTFLIKYKVLCDGSSSTYVSEIEAVKSDNKFLLSKEKIISVKVKQ